MTLRKTPQIASEYTDLEIRIFPCQASGYPVEITLRGEQEFPRGWLAGEAASWKPVGGPSKDGPQLFQTLLNDPKLLTAWTEARGSASKRRIRLRIDPGAPELHALPWELMADDQGPLAAGPDTPFSRYLPVAMPWAGAVGERPIRVLALISNPADLPARGQACVDVAQERSILEEGLSASGESVQVDYLVEGVTLEALEAKLRENYHVLHYIGHGMTSKRGQSALLLQDDTGNTRFVTDDALCGMLARLPVRPRLVFLSACQSATRSIGDAFLGLAPLLVKAGVPAVIAMQDLLSMPTGQMYGRVFYERLAAHGQVDCASNEARASLVTAGRPDAHVPVLFMRLKSGALWSDESNVRGVVFGKGPTGAFWPTLVTLIKKDQVVPVVGGRVHSRWLPSPEETALALAAKHGYPFRNRDDLSRVAQYLATSSGEYFLSMEYVDTLVEAFRNHIADEQLPDGPPESLSALISSSGWKERALSDPTEVHGLLASLGLPLYLTGNCDNLLEEALLASGRQPVSEQCQWSDEVSLLSDVLSSGMYKFTDQAPVVYHLFGTNQDLQSLVLSEDQYFRYLYNIASVFDRVPSSIRGKMSTSAIMFVGFSLYDLEFRVIMQGLIKNIENRFKLRHVAVQLDESDAAGTDEETVQKFLTQYFSEADINVYWGTTAQFVAELREVWDKAR